MIATAVAGVAIFSASGFIALQDEPFRRPATVVVSTPEAVSAEPQVAVPTAEPASSGYPDDDAKASSPSIINVAPPREDAGSVVVIRDPSALGQDLRVAHLPDPALIEESEYGPLPTRSEDGRRPFDVYARPWSGARGARVAIVIGGLGVSQTGTQTAIAELPSEVTLAFASGGNSLDRWMRTARQEGHEIVMQLPLEPFDYPQVDPGRNTLTVDAAPAENRDRLYWALSRITNYTGVMNYMGARFVSSDAAMDPLFGELAERGLMYVDDGSTQRSVAEEMAKRKSVPFAAADMAIDAERERGAILKKLDELERIARAKGFAVGTGSAFDITVDAVSSWVAEARSRGIEIVPISAVAVDPEKD
jgi:polysaccharide deacetylase 2 family uncharacterized protein YibQ